MSGRILKWAAAGLLLLFPGAEKSLRAQGAGEADESMALTYFRLAYEYRESGDNENALEQLRKASDYEPDNAEIFYALGVVLFDLERYGEAKESFLKSLNRDRVFDEKLDVEKLAKEGLYLAEEREKAKGRKKKLYVAVFFICAVVIVLGFFTFRQFVIYSKQVRAKRKKHPYHGGKRDHGAQGRLL